MTSRPKQAEPRPQTRLYLVTPPVEDTQDFTAALMAALAAGDVAAVLLRLAPSDERTLINRAKALAAVVQDAGAALVLDGHADLVARAGADGAHLSDIGAFTEAIEILKPERIAGCGGLATRHDAMLAAEQGADYVMFGEPGAGGHRPSLAAIEERVAWWAEVFEAPCVAYAGTLAEVAPLAKAGADFIALGDSVWSTAGMAEGAIAQAMRLMRLPETAA